MAFQDFNLKLAIIESLRETGLFEKEVMAIIEQHWDHESINMKPIPQIEAFFRDLVLTDEMLAKVEEVCLDGGSDVYHDMIPNWDGEDDIFDVQSLADLALLPNLHSIDVFALLGNADLNPLLEIPKLKIVMIDKNIEVQNPDVLEVLVERGVEVSR